MKAIRLSGVTLPGSGYPALSNFLPIPAPAFPVTTGLAGLYTLGSSEQLSLPNRVNAALPLVKVGAPVIAAQGATLSQANCYDTSLPSTSLMTIIAVAKLQKPTTVNGADAVTLCANYQNLGAGNVGDTLTLTSSGGVPVVAAYGQGSGSTSQSTLSIASGNVGEWNTFAMRIGASTAARAWWSKSGVVTASGTSATTSRSVQARTLRVGGHYEPTQFQANDNVLMCAIFQGALSDADIASNLAYLSATWGPSLGIATL